MKTSIWVLTALSLTFLLGDIAPAAPISFQLAGTIEVTDDYDLLPPDIVTGLPFTGRLTYDSSAQDAAPDDPRLGSYGFVSSPLAHALAITVGPHRFESVSTPSQDGGLPIIWVWVVDDATDSLQRLGYLAGDSLSLDAPFSGPVRTSVQMLELLFWDPRGDALGMDELPKTFSAADYQMRRVTILGEDGVGQPVYQIVANIDSIAAVPEPPGHASAALASLAFVGIVFAARRRRPQAAEGRTLR